MNYKKSMYSITCSILLIITLCKAEKEEEPSHFNQTVQTLAEKATYVKETVAEQLETARETLAPYAKAAQEKITHAAGKVKEAVSAGIEKIGQATESYRQASAEKMLRTVAGEPKLPACNITNIYGKQLKVKIRHEGAEDFEQFYITPGDNITLKKIPHIVMVSYSGIKESKNGLMLNAYRLKKRRGIDHIFLLVKLENGTATCAPLDGIVNNITQALIKKAQASYTFWQKEYGAEMAEDLENGSQLQQLKKSAKEIKKGYKEVARQALEVEKTLKPYVELVEDE